MSKNKQFILNDDLSGLQGYKCIMDNYADVDTWYTLGATVNLLNKLSEENEQLKKDNEHIETCFKMADSTYNILQKQYWNIENALSKYRKENENLKKVLNELSEENASIKGRIIDAMVKSNQVECNCTTCVCEDYVNEELKK